MTNLIKAIINIESNFSALFFKENYIDKNSHFSDALKFFIIDSFAGTYNDESEMKILKYSNSFSWVGNNMNPPDLEIKNGDSVIIKKLSLDKVSLSNYPCSNIESKEKNGNTNTINNKKIIYCIGEQINNNNLKICFFYGELIAANENVYERFLNKINDLNNFEKIDPLGITTYKDNLWKILNPNLIFELSSDKNASLEVVTIIPDYIFEDFKLDIMSIINNSNFKICNKIIRSPNDGASIIKCKSITFTV